MLTGNPLACSSCIVICFNHCRAYHGHLSTLLSLSTYKMKSVGPHCIMVCLARTHTRTHTHTVEGYHIHHSVVVSCILVDTFLMCLLSPGLLKHFTIKFMKDKRFLLLFTGVLFVLGEIKLCTCHVGTFARHLSWPVQKPRHCGIIVC